MWGGKCEKNCPAHAISTSTEVAKELPNGNKLYRRTIDTNRCIKCGACKTSCPVDAIITK